jgi:hypothetical protein
MEKFAKSENQENTQFDPTLEISSLEESSTESDSEEKTAHAPDFVDMALMGFSEDELKQLIRLRRRFEQGDHEATPEVIRLRFARYLYENGKIAA